MGVSATVSDDQPCQYTQVTVSIEVTDDGSPVEGVHVVSTWHYKSSSPTEESDTGADGKTEHTRGISGASTSHTVTVEVNVTHGDLKGSASTSFLPQSC